VDDELFLNKNIKAATKEEALKRIALFVSEKLKADTNFVLNSLLVRENIRNTGLEKGIAAPHIILFNSVINRAYIAVITFCTPITDWVCLDGSLVEKALCLIVPQELDSSTIGIKDLTTIFRFLADDEKILEISKTTSSEAIVSILKMQN